MAAQVCGNVGQSEARSSKRTNHGLAGRASALRVPYIKPHINPLLQTRVVTTSPQKLNNGSYQANSKKVDRWQGPAQTAGHKGRKEICPRHWRCEETSPLQAWNCRSERDPSLSEEHRASDPQAPFPETGARDRPGLQNRPALPELSCHGFARG